MQPTRGDFLGNDAEILTERRRFAGLEDEERIEARVRPPDEWLEGDGALLAGRVAKHGNYPIAPDQPQGGRQRPAANRLEDQIEVAPKRGDVAHNLDVACL